MSHRGNRGGIVFFEEADYRRYLALLSKCSQRFGMEIWAYCFMTNHIHLIVVGRQADSVSRAMGLIQGQYSRSANRRNGWTGHLWGNRFFSTLLDETHLWAAVRYVEQNPVRAGMVQHPVDYPWSSTRAHALGASDPLLSENRPFPGAIGDWNAWLAEGLDAALCERLRRNTSTGHPSGSSQFTQRLEDLLGRRLRPSRRGRRPSRTDRDLGFYESGPRVKR